MAKGSREKYCSFVQLESVMQVQVVFFRPDGVDTAIKSINAESVAPFLVIVVVLYRSPRRHSVLCSNQDHHMLMEFAEYSDGSSAIQVDPSNCGNFRKEVFEVKFNLPKNLEITCKKQPPCLRLLTCTVRMAENSCASCRQSRRMNENKESQYQQQDWQKSIAFRSGSQVFSGSRVVLMTSRTVKTQILGPKTSRCFLEIPTNDFGKPMNSRFPMLNDVKPTKH